MNIVQVIIMEKDKGYAWIILGASTILMCIGPSTFTSAGFLLNGVKITERTQEWILNVFYIFWVISAFIAACFAKQRPRQFGVFGTLLASVGFISSSSVKDPYWLYMTFSTAVGFGLGLSFHTAYLVVMSNFNRYKGLANGVCQFFIALGQIITPLLFAVVSMPRDRFQIKSLTTAVGFLTTLFFVVVPAPPPPRNRRFSTVSRTSRRGSFQGEATVPLHTGFVPIPSNSIPINQVRTRRRSQYLLQVSTSLLPNIPEEPEGTHSTITSASSDSDVSSILHQSVPSVSVISRDTHSKPETTGNGPNQPAEDKKENNVSEKHADNGLSIKSHPPLRKVSLPSPPSPVLPLLTEENLNLKYIKDSQHNKSNPNGTQSKGPPPRFRRFSESQLESSKKQAQVKSQQQVNAPLTSSKSHHDLQSASLTSTSTKSSSQEKEPARAGKNSVVKGESIIDCSLLRDFHFLIMASFSSMCTVTVVTYPVLFYNFVTSRCPENCQHQADLALTIIYVVDLISRLLFSYFSDMEIFSRRMGFLIASLVVGITIAATPLADEVVSIYFISVIYGLCMGMLATCQYLMFIESFGLEKFSQAYGFLHVIQILVVGVLGLIVGINPLSVYNYPIRPFGDSSNNTLFDPLEIFQTDVVSEDSVSVVRLLIGAAIPSILCAFAFITEDIYKASQKCSSAPANSKVNTNTNDVP